MCVAMGFANVTPWEIAEQGEYWQNAVIVEYQVEQDPQVQAYHEKQRKSAEENRKKRSEAEQQNSSQRRRSRERAGDNHLAPVEK